MTEKRSWHLQLMDDHQTTEKILAAVENLLSKSSPLDSSVLAQVLEYLTVYLDQCHNRKEEEHLFPLLERRGIPREAGPLAVMLSEHAESRALLGRLKPLADAYIAGNHDVLQSLSAVFAEYSALLKSHFWKENDILYPLALQRLSDEDGAAVVRGIETTEAAIGSEARARYYLLADRIVAFGNLQDLSFGLDRDVLAALLNTLPVELSFVDAEDTLRYFSHENQDKIFGRTRGAIGTKVQNCHPRKSLDKVNEILEDFKANRRSVAEFWIDFGGRKVHIRYFAVRDDAKRYLGCLEVVQDVTRIQQLQGERRLLDE